MSVNVQTVNGLKQIADKTTKNKVLKVLGYTPANEEDLINHRGDTDIHISSFEREKWNNKPETYEQLREKPSISEDDTKTLYVVDEKNNIIAFIDDYGIHTTALAVKTEQGMQDIVSLIEDSISEHNNEINEKLNDIRDEIITDYNELENRPIETENDDNTLYVTDNDGNIIAYIDGTGLHAYNLYVNNDNVALKKEIENFATKQEVTNEINANNPGFAYNKDLNNLNENLNYISNKTNEAQKKAENAYNLAEKVDKEQFSGKYDDLENKPIENEATDNSLYITDNNGNVIAYIDNTGLHAYNLYVNQDSVALKKEIENFATKKNLADEVANLVGSSPEALNTLKELADALGNDENFAVNITNLISEKLDKKDAGKFALKKEILDDYNELKNKPVENETVDNTLYIVDENGNIVALFDNNGLKVSNITMNGKQVATLDDIPTSGGALPTDPEFNSVKVGETTYHSDHINYKGYSLDFPETDGTLATLDDIPTDVSLPKNPTFNSVIVESAIYGLSDNFWIGEGDRDEQLGLIPIHVGGFDSTFLKLRSSKRPVWATEDEEVELATLENFRSSSTNNGFYIKDSDYPEIRSDDGSVYVSFDDSQNGEWFYFPTPIASGSDRYLVTEDRLKTINGQSLIGSGDITISGSASVDLSNYYTKTEADNNFLKPSFQNDNEITIADKKLEIYKKSNGHVISINPLEDKISINDGNKIILSSKQILFSNLDNETYSYLTRNGTLHSTSKVTLSSPVRPTWLNGTVEKELATLDDIPTGGGELPTDPEFDSITLEDTEEGAKTYISPYSFSQTWGGRSITFEAESGSLRIDTGSYGAITIGSESIRRSENNKNYTYNFPDKSGTIAVEDTNTTFKSVQVLDDDGNTQISGGYVGVSWFTNSKRAVLSAEEGGVIIQDTHTDDYTNYYQDEIAMRKDGKPYTLKFPEKSGTLATLDDMYNPSFGSVSIDGMLEIRSDSQEIPNPPNEKDIDTYFYSKGIVINNCDTGEYNYLYFPQKTGTLLVNKDLNPIKSEIKEIKPKVSTNQARTVLLEENLGKILPNTTGIVVGDTLVVLNADVDGDTATFIGSNVEGETLSFVESLENFATKDDLNQKSQVQIITWEDDD